MANVPPSPQYGAPPPAARKGGVLKWLLIGCGAVTLFVVIIGAVMFFGISKATEGPEKAVKAFLAAAAAGDYAAAHNYFSEPLKQVQPYDDFANAARSQPQFFAITHTSFSNRSIDQNGAELSGNVTLQNGTKVPAQFKLVKEQDQWKLISYNIGS